MRKIVTSTAELCGIRVNEFPNYICKENSSIEEIEPSNNELIQENAEDEEGEFEIKDAVYLTPQPRRRPIPTPQPQPRPIPTSQQRSRPTSQQRQRPRRQRPTPKPKPKKKIYYVSEQHIKAVKEIVEEFEKSRRWVILTAQMQSGKTTTYYLTATVMLMKRLVDKVIIFSGNNENELKIQINEEKNELIKYLNRNQTALATFGNNMNIFDVIDLLEENLVVLWGGYDIKKYEGHNLDDKVLYIWDESHAAQDTNNMPAQFLKDYDISGCGCQENLEEQNSYMLSVSATPFSEISDNKHEEQNKSIVNLEVGNSYHGVKKMIEKGLIRKYEYNDWEEHLIETLNRHKRREPKYALIRLRENKVISSDEMIRIITDAGWKCSTFDSSNDSDIKNISKLEDQPEIHEVIILKGKCRMGKVVPKQFIAFCMETSKKSNTDVILQGLLGRMCGYPKPGTPIYEVEIHLSHYAFKTHNNTNEFEKYMRYIQANDTIPHRAKNILSGQIRKRSKFYPIIPIRIRFNEHYNYNKNNICNKVIQLFSENISVYNDNVTDYNNDIQKCELFNRFNGIDDKTIKVRYIENENTYIQLDVPNRIHNLIASKKNERVHLSYSGTKMKNEFNGEIILWVFKKSFEEYGIIQGDIFVDAETKNTTIETFIRNQETDKIPPTTKKEVFCEMMNYLENETDCESGYDTDGSLYSSCY